MNRKLLVQRGWFFLLVAGVYLLGQYLRGVWFLGSFVPNLCGNANVGGVPFCNSPYLDAGWALIVFGEYLFVTALLVFFANQQGWRIWLRVSAFLIPIAGLTTFIWFPQPFIAETVIDQTAVAGFFGMLYLVITGLIVLIYRIKGAKKV